MSLEPTTPGLALSRHALLASAFEILGRSLGPFVDRHMSQYFPREVDWALAAANRMGRASDHEANDPLFQLLVLRRFWGPVFASSFDEDLRGTIVGLLEARNRWAHLNLPDDPAQLERTLLGVERLLAPVAPAAVSQVRVLRAAVRSPLPGADLAPPPVDVIVLEAQLSEAEAAFEDLQARYDQVTSQLEATRRAAAQRQLRLSAAELDVAKLEDRSVELEGVLVRERTTLHRIEWLVVGLIAAVILMLVLITA